MSLHQNFDKASKFLIPDHHNTPGSFSPSIKYEMMEKITIKNKANWVLTLIIPIGLLILLFLIVVLLPLVSVESLTILSILNYLYNAAIPIGFFIFLLYVWLWNTFGKTVFEISSNGLKITTKNKLFSSPRIFLKDEIQKIGILDLGIERTKYYVRLNYLFSNANQSVTITTNQSVIRIVDWLTLEEAENITKKLELNLQIRKL
ncbi:hypothetical protein [Pedobacter frigoris]|uniref:hypothetical protein n=1 Tax=Pedobacter frigoris TaxID=2571272 RepID=UPI00292F146E|nr:hypothetical protein [Pedobacter frigoris]